MNESKWLGDLVREMMAPKLAEKEIEIMAKGKAEGKAEGKASLILNLLASRYPARHSDYHRAHPPGARSFGPRSLVQPYDRRHPRGRHSPRIHPLTTTPPEMPP